MGVTKKDLQSEQIAHANTKVALQVEEDKVKVLQEEVALLKEEPEKVQASLKKEIRDLKDHIKRLKSSLSKKDKLIKDRDSHIKALSKEPKVKYVEAPKEVFVEKIRYVRIPDMSVLTEEDILRAYERIKDVS